MADNINFNNITNQHSFVSRKELPWHGLGHIVEAMTSKEAIKLGGLDFEVEKRPLYYPSNIDLEHGEATKLNWIGRDFIHEKVEGVDSRKARYRQLIVNPEKFSTVRADNNIHLGTVGSRYEVIQNQEAFDFFDSIVGDKYAEYETVGALGNGETVFITAKLKADMVINKDQIDNYLLISMSHDGTSSITVMFTPIRVVCNNTLSLALQGKNKVVIKHTKNARKKLEHSKEVLGLIDVAGRSYKSIFEHMTKVSIKDNEAEYIIAESLGLKPNEEGKLSTKAMNILESAKKYYEEGIGQREIIGTGWGVYNAVTGYLQNVKEYKDEDTKYTNTFMKNSARDIASNLILSFT